MSKFIRNQTIIRIIATIATIALCICVAGCGKNAIQQNSLETALHGQWAYAHDEAETVAAFYEDGTAKFQGVKYEYTCEDGYIFLKDKEGQVTKLRYMADGDRMYVYIQSTYQRQPEGGGSGIVGVWRSEEGWTFEFTDKGTFMEDGALTGYYEVKEESKSIKLMYGEALEDTYFYFELTGDELFVEYPWLMIRR